MNQMLYLYILTLVFPGVRSFPSETNIPALHRISAVAAISDGTICTGTCDGALTIFDSTGTELGSCVAHEGGLNALVVHAKKRLVLSSGKDSHACLWHISSEGQASPLVRCGICTYRCLF